MAVLSTDSGPGRDDAVESLPIGDIQGLVLSGYGHLSCAAYLMLQVTDPAAARRWLAGVAAELTTGTSRTPPYVNLALTYAGLAALGLHPDDLKTFPSAFRDGMASERRARILGDRQESAPAAWRWGGPSTEPVHLLLMIFERDADRLNAELARRRLGIGPATGLHEVTTLEAGRQPDSREHFGFADGIAQPVIEGTVKSVAGRPSPGAAPVVKPGEFLLGYPNAYGQPADVSTVAPGRDRANLLPTVRPDQLRGLTDNQPGDHDLGRNGTYLVFRQLAQDVAGFWRFLDDAARAHGLLGAGGRAYLGAKLVGRWPSGAPLVKSPDADPLAGSGELSTDNDFGYAAADPHGFACPIGAHIRRANPRDSLVTSHIKAPQAAESANRHLLLRRGRSYGDRLPDMPFGDEIPEDDGRERGLLFACLNADVERQFEFVQQTWINNPVFGGLGGEVDPLIGDQEKVDGTMTIPGDPLRTRVRGMRRFVTVKGGAYFFLPSRSALIYLAGLENAPGERGSD